MNDDPTIDRIRATRHEISEQCGHDPNRLVEHYMKLQERHRERILKDESEQTPVVSVDETT